jgi:hypothetical protein
VLGKDPNHARANGWLAYTYVTGIIDGWDFSTVTGAPPAQYALGQSLLHANSAVASDPDDFDNYWAKAFVLLHTNDPDGAKANFDNARAENISRNHHLLIENADERVFAGDPDKALRLIVGAVAGMKSSQQKQDWHRWVHAWALYFKARKDGTPELYITALVELGKLAQKPGKYSKAPSEILLTLAALHGQMCLNNLGPDPVNEEKLAKKSLDAYGAERGNIPTIQEIKVTNPFQDPDDLTHWLAGLKVAGVN